MLLAYFHWWWDSMGLDRAQVVLAVLGTVLAGAALVYAWRVARRQFQLMDEQGRIIDKQVELMKEQTAADVRVADLTVELKAILARQGEIAETQFNIMMEQRAKLAKLRILTSGGALLATEMSKHIIYVQNSGTKTASHFHWRVYVPSEYMDDKYIQVNLTGATRTLMGSVLDDGDDDTFYDGYHGFCSSPVFPGRHVDLGYVLIRGAIESQVKLRWFIESEDGVFPNGDDSDIISELS